MNKNMQRKFVHYRAVASANGKYISVAYRVFILSLCLTTACDTELRKSDAELGLNPHEAMGRRIYEERCDRCHEPYSTRAKKGHSMKGIFEKNYLPQSGLPANDAQVGDIIRYGRNQMPAFGQVLNQQQIQDLLAYLHRL
jgi:mono/diheme cytochrome c family protein